MDRPVNVLIVDDSRVAQLLLVHILESDPLIRVAGVVGDGEAAVAFVQKHRPDVVLMDIHMPRMDGLEATRRIMETYPVPVIACSATARVEEAATAFRVLEAGALTCLKKPVGRDHADYTRLADDIRQTVKVMSEVKVVRRWPRVRRAATSAYVDQRTLPSPGNVKVVGIGASTGGPQALQDILGALPKPFPVPILVVQHIAAGFVAGLSEWLQQTTGLQTRVATYGVMPVAGHVYLAPDDFHMGLTASGRITLTKEPVHDHVRPSVSYLFRSLAHVHGPNAIGVLLTGMGKDGAAELKQMKDRGAITFAQDAESAVVNGMPGEAVRLGAVTHVLPTDRIADRLVTVLAERNGYKVDA